MVTDRKLAVDDGTGGVDYYIADVVSQSDYFPFGMVMPGRNDNTPEYRYGFNGMEKDDEVSGEANSYDFGARFYNPRIGRWLSRDPVFRKQPGWSPYKAMFDSPLVYSDPDGKTEYLKTIIRNEMTGETIEITRAVSDDLMRSHVYEDGSVHYDDYTRTETYTITEDGMYYEESDSYTTGEERITVPGFIPKGVAKTLVYGLEGDGETQKGGYQLTTKSGGVSTTKTIAENDVESVDIGDLLTALGALGKSGKINVPGSYFKKMKVVLPDKYTQFTYDAFKKIMNVVKKTDLKPSPTDNNGNTAPPATVITKTGDGIDQNNNVDVNDSNDEDTTITTYTFENNGAYTITKEKRVTMKKSEYKKRQNENNEGGN